MSSNHKIAVTDPDLTNLSSSPSDESFHSCTEAHIGEMAEKSDHCVEQQFKTTQQSNLSEKILVEAESITPLTSGPWIKGASDEVNAALEAARADWRKREVLAAEAVASVKAEIDKIIVMNDARKQGQMSPPAGKRRQYKWKNSQKETHNHGSNSTSSATDINVPPTNPSIPQAKGSRLEVYVPPYRLRSPQENALISRTMLSDLPQPHRKTKVDSSAVRVPSAPPDHSHGGLETGGDTIFSVQEEEAHVRMLAWENWAFRNILMYRFGLSRQDINVALDVEKQRLAAGERSYYEPS